MIEMADWIREQFIGCKECKLKLMMRSLNKRKSGICVCILKKVHSHDGSPNQYRRCWITENKISWFNDMTLAELATESSDILEFICRILSEEQNDLHNIFIKLRNGKTYP